MKPVLIMVSSFLSKNTVEGVRWSHHDHPRKIYLTLKTASRFYCICDLNIHSAVVSIGTADGENFPEKRTLREFVASLELM